MLLADSKKHIVAIHQPDFMPWLGFLDKIFRSQTFVILDDCEWSKNSFYRRVYVKTPSKEEKSYLIIPLQKCSDYENIRNVKVDWSQNWIEKHLAIIRNSYRKAPYFKNFEFIESLYKSFENKEYVNELNIGVIHSLANYFGFQTKLVQSSNFHSTAVKNERNLFLVQSVGGNIYYSGSQAREYNDLDLYERNGIKLFYSDIFDVLDELKYPQVDTSSFMNGLSFIDSLLNIGREGILELLEKAKTHRFNAERLIRTSSKEC